VLLLEDDPALHRVLAEGLGEEGFAVVSCVSYPALCDAAVQGQGDVALADFWGSSQQMLSAAERQQITALGALIPTVLSTGRAWLGQVTAEELGVAACLRKPYDLDAVLRAVQGARTRRADSRPSPV
jgi:DNA-binding response OmpR family regulator